MEEEKSAPKWETTTNRFVIYLDIMGFKDMMSKDGHDSVLEKVKRIRGMFNMLVNRNEAHTWANTPIELKSYSFSDSIFIFSESDTATDLLTILLRFKLILQLCFSEKIPVKGVMSFGKITADFENSIFVGQPIIDAYLLHEELNMFGIILDHHAENKLKEYFEDIAYKGNLNFSTIQYKTPFKGGKISHYCIKWPSVVLTDAANNSVLHLKDKTFVEHFYSTVSGKPRMYIDNTIDFIDYLIELAKKEHPEIEESALFKKRN